MKLELKHLAPYLPYKLKCLAQGEDKKVFDIQGITDFTDVDLHEKGRTVNEQYDIEDVFPILRPLSDLTKEIEVNGEKFVPFTNNVSMYQFIDGAFYCNNYGKFLEIKEMPYIVIEKLFEWHFDVFGLIEKGLAIDINTLN
jgi:hypothetical protein